MATSLAGSSVPPRTSFREFEKRPVVQTTEAVALGVLVAGALTWFIQHVVKPQRSLVSGRVLTWCQSAPTPQPLAGGSVVLVGSAGPGAGSVFEAVVDGAGKWGEQVPPGLYVIGVMDAAGRQAAPMVITPQIASGQEPLTTSLELVYDVWAQVVVPASGQVSVDLVVAC